jgi:hypothetical protein
MLDTFAHIRIVSEMEEALPLPIDVAVGAGLVFAGRLQMPCQLRAF